LHHAHTIPYYIKNTPYNHVWESLSSHTYAQKKTPHRHYHRLSSTSATTHPYFSTPLFIPPHLARETTLHTFPIINAGPFQAVDISIADSNAGWNPDLLWSSNWCCEGRSEEHGEGAENESWVLHFERFGYEMLVQVHPKT